MAEATQAALDDAENRRQARSLAQGAGHTFKDQGRRDVTLRTTCGQVIVRATRDHPRPGEVVKVKVDTAHLHLFDGATGLRVGE